MYEFRWEDWNIGHIAEHGVSVEDAEYVINHPSGPYPRRAGDRKFLVVGHSAEGQYLQVVYVMDSMEQVFVIHARPLTRREQHRLRRGRHI